MLTVTPMAMMGLVQPVKTCFPGADHAGRYGDENADGDNSGNGGADAAGINMMLTSLASRAITSINLLRNLKTRCRHLMQ